MDANTAGGTTAASNGITPSEVKQQLRSRGLPSHLFGEDDTARLERLVELNDQQNSGEDGDERYSPTKETYSPQQKEAAAGRSMMQEEIDDIFADVIGPSEDEHDDDEDRGRGRGRERRPERASDGDDDDDDDDKGRGRGRGTSGSSWSEYNGVVSSGSTIDKNNKPLASLQAYLTKRHGATTVRGKGDVRIYEYGDPVPYIGKKGGLAVLQGIEIGKAGADRLVLCGSVMFELEEKPYMVIGVMYHGKPLVEGRRNSKKKKLKRTWRLPVWALCISGQKCQDEGKKPEALLREAYDEIEKDSSTIAWLKYAVRIRADEIYLHGGAIEDNWVNPSLNDIEGSYKMAEHVGRQFGVQCGGRATWWTKIPAVAVS